MKIKIKPFAAAKALALSLLLLSTLAAAEVKLYKRSWYDQGSLVGYYYGITSQSLAERFRGGYNNYVTTFHSRYEHRASVLSTHDVRSEATSQERRYIRSDDGDKRLLNIAGRSQAGLASTRAYFAQITSTSSSSSNSGSSALREKDEGDEETIAAVILVAAGWWWYGREQDFRPTDAAANRRKFLGCLLMSGLLQSQLRPNTHPHLLHIRHSDNRQMACRLITRTWVQ